MDLSDLKYPIIPVIYLAPLLGNTQHPGMDQMLNMACQDIEKLIPHGIQAILLENEHNSPYTVSATREDIASMSVLAAKIVEQFPKIYIGCEFLINDPMASLAMTKAAGGKFIRTDYYVDRMGRPEYGGEMYINPQEILDYREKIQAKNILLLTDIQVKYAVMLENKTLADSAIQAAQYGSSAVVVSSEQTGTPPTVEDLRNSRAGNIPILIGSGLSIENGEHLLPHCDGAIVGSALMTETRMDEKKIAPFMAMVKKVYDE